MKIKMTCYTVDNQIKFTENQIFRKCIFFFTLGGRRQAAEFVGLMETYDWVNQTFLEFIFERVWEFLE